MMIKPADRLNQVGEYYFSHKLEEIRKLTAQGRQVLNLGIGSPDMPPVKTVVDELVTSARQEGHHAYQSYRSIPALRAAMARYYQRTFAVQLDATHGILPLLGSKEGVMYVSMAFLNPGDVVLVPDPGYPAYGAVARLLGAEVQYYDLTEANGWQPDFAKLAQLDWSRVKLMWINYPHMPTGARSQATVFDRLVALARQHDFLLVNDNPYSQVLNDRPLSLLSVDADLERSLELNSLSKSFNMAGWRVGMVAGHPHYINAILQAKSNVDSGMFLPIQHAAIRALDLDAGWHNERNDIYKARRQRAVALLTRLGCSVADDQAGMFVWARLPQGVNDDFKWVDELLYGARVFVTPGGVFGKNGRGYVRMSLCAAKEVYEEAMNRILQWQKSNLQSA